MTPEIGFTIVRRPITARAGARPRRLAGPALYGHDDRRSGARAAVRPGMPGQRPLSDRRRRPRRPPGRRGAAGLACRASPAGAAKPTSTASRSGSNSPIPATSSATGPSRRPRWRRWSALAATILARHPIAGAPCARPFRRGAGAQAGPGRVVRLGRPGPRRHRPVAGAGGVAAGARCAAATAARTSSGSRRRSPTYGYGLVGRRPLRRRDRLVVEAFQRHFRPRLIDGRGRPRDARPTRRAAGDCCVDRAARAALPRAGSDGRMAAFGAFGRSGEESPGSTETRCRVIPGGGDPRESATESKPPARLRAGG